MILQWVLLGIGIVNLFLLILVIAGLVWVNYKIYEMSTGFSNLFVKLLKRLEDVTLKESDDEL